MQAPFQGSDCRIFVNVMLYERRIHRRDGIIVAVVYVSMHQGRGGGIRIELRGKHADSDNSYNTWQCSAKYIARVPESL